MIILGGLPVLDVWVLDIGLSFLTISAGFSCPSRFDCFARNRRPPSRRQRSRSRLTTLGRAQLAQGNSGRIARVRNLGGRRGLAGRLLDDLISELIGIARALSCSGRHTPIVAQ
jgi:hypothetical protein